VPDAGASRFIGEQAERLFTGRPSFAFHDTAPLARSVSRCWKVVPLDLSLIFCLNASHAKSSVLMPRPIASRPLGLGSESRTEDDPIEELAPPTRHKGPQLTPSLVLFVTSEPQISKGYQSGEGGRGEWWICPSAKKLVDLGPPPLPSLRCLGAFTRNSQSPPLSRVSSKSFRRRSWCNSFGPAQGWIRSRRRPSVNLTGEPPPPLLVCYRVQGLGP